MCIKSYRCDILCIDPLLLCFYVKDLLTREGYSYIYVFNIDSLKAFLKTIYITIAIISKSMLSQEAETFPQIKPPPIYTRHTILSHMHKLIIIFLKNKYVCILMACIWKHSFYQDVSQGNLSPSKSQYASWPSWDQERTNW